MKIKTMLGLAAAGGFLYLHKQRGGQWTLDSFKDTFRELFESVRSRAMEVREQAQETLERTADRVSQSVHEMSTSGDRGEEIGDIGAGANRQY